MEYRNLGRSGLVVSTVAMGCNNFGGRMDNARAQPVVDAAIDLGVTLFDTADIYGNLFGNIGGSELALGTMLRGKRDRVVLATKFGYEDRDMGYGLTAGAKGGRSYIRRAVEASLERLQTDHIDLLQFHSPDRNTPILETLAALHELVQEGKVRYLGHSNFTGWQLAEAEHVARENSLTPFISTQNRWSLLERDWEAAVLPAARHYGVGVLPYMPLAQGLLTGKVKRGEALPAGSKIAGSPDAVTDTRLDQMDRLSAWAIEHGRTLLEVALGGLISRDGVVSLVVGASTADQVRSNVEASDWRATPDELAAIDAIVPPPPALAY
jgi:aryl-alcohol dehydrogenase-like predicted oxidoreductase